MLGQSLISDELRQVLLRDRNVDVSDLARSYSSRSYRTLKISVSSAQIALLIDSASLGWRVYELMSIQRPGDLLNYLVVSWVEINPLIEKVIRKANMDDFNIRFHSDKPLPKLPFPKVDYCFAWRGDDTSNADEAWCKVRDSGYWRDIIAEIFPIVQQAQHHLQQSEDSLIQRELKMIAAYQHPDMFLSEVRRQTEIQSLPPLATNLPAELFDYLRELVSHPDTLSVSGQLNDYHLWRVLIELQLKRADDSGLPPRKALGLGSADCGIPWLGPRFLGADIHVPYEGVCGGDVFFMPDWFNFDVGHATQVGRLKAGTGGKHCRFLVTQKDFGELPFAHSQCFGAWRVYEDNDLVSSCNTFNDS